MDTKKKITYRDDWWLVLHEAAERHRRAQKAAENPDDLLPYAYSDVPTAALKPKKKRRLI